MAKTKMNLKTLSWEPGEWNPPAPGIILGEKERTCGGNGGKLHIEQEDGTVQEYLFPAGEPVAYSPGGGWVEIPDSGTPVT